MKFRDQKRMADVGQDDLSGGGGGDLCLPLEHMTDSMMLQTAMEILKEDERQIVLLHVSAGLKHREISENLGIPLSTVLSKYNRAMKKLQNYLQGEA